MSNWIVIFCVEAAERQNNPVTSLRGYSDELVGTKTSTKEVEATFCPAEDNSSLTGNVKHYVTTPRLLFSCTKTFTCLVLFNGPLAAVGLLIWQQVAKITTVHRCDDTSFLLKNFRISLIIIHNY